ncbi:MAG TPA: hypothetical protein VJW93_09820, partial [Candidatus Acidoferrales bacterium]|nr:hypothetical protein [Candidatus Acidoferrales bacterium]
MSFALDVLKSAFRPFIGTKTFDEVLSPKNTSERGERQLICCVTNLFDFDSLCLNADPAEIGRVLDGYYARIA